MKTSKCKKRRFRDRISALLALADTGRDKHTRSDKEERRIYWCPDCKGWHLTSRGMWR